MSEKPGFDLETVYDEQIAPLMSKIIAICMEHKMPFVADFMYKSDGKDDHYHCTSALLPNERKIDARLEQAYDAVVPRRAPTLMLTTRDKDGNVTITAIAP